MAKFKSTARVPGAKKPAPSARSTASSGPARKKPAATKPAAARSKAAPKAAAPRTIMDSAQQIWQTGVKALGRAQQESTRLFEALVKEGAGVEKKTRTLASGKVDSVRDAVETRVGQVKERATDTWDRLEKVFEERVQRALVRLGVPGREELQALIERVDELNARLRKLAAAEQPAAGGKTAKPAQKAAAKKTTPATAAAKAKKSAGNPPVKASTKKPVAGKTSATPESQNTPTQDTSVE